MKKLLRVLRCNVLIILLFGCTLNPDSGNTEQSIGSSSLEVRNENNASRPSIGEAFDAYPLVKSGLLEITVKNAVLYQSLSAAGISMEQLDPEIQLSNAENQPGDRWYNPENGTAMPGKAFVLVELELHNDSAISRLVDFSGTKGIIYEEDEFDIGGMLGIYPLPKKNAEQYTTVGLGTMYHSFADASPDKPGILKISRGDTISCQIGAFVFKTVEEYLIPHYGGELHESLLDRLYLTTSNSVDDPMVYLNLMP